MSKTKPSVSLPIYSDEWWKARGEEHRDKPNAQDLIDADNAKREEITIKAIIPPKPTAPGPKKKPFGLD